MGIVVEKLGHKLALVAIMTYFSSIFITICLPAMWINYRVHTIEFYIVSISIMFIGGIFFDIIIFNKFRDAKKDIEDGIPKSTVLKIFGGQLIASTIILLPVTVLTGEIIPNLYFILLLVMGGYCWFWILEGYIKANNKKNDYNDKDDYNPWLGRVLLIGIALSLMLGSLYLMLTE
ncbi:hypothetical protein [Virgibacillus salexigens]|uniref:Prenyltransferase n=1 Tax=Virgibacillus kapii TaxID=1638645 RepID=A0ABQ2DH54_9BACI|nr:hypothetical protein [Virgibacillus kapii]GGJ55334.1 hypothetical protein GCM10007111_17030 [Virgibacillus kapii]